MKDKTIVPLSLAYGYPIESSMLFITPSGKVEISGCNSELKELLPLCDGTRSLAKIADQLSERYDKDDLLRLAYSLIENGVLRSGSALYEGFHQQSENPMRFLIEASDDDLRLWSSDLQRPEFLGQCFNLKSPQSHLMKIADKRRSTREFARTDSLRKNLFQGLLLATYSLGSLGKYNIPSGGALYPVRQYCITLDERVGMPSGSYYIDPDSHQAILIESSVTKEAVSKCFYGLTKTLENACLIQVLTANFHRATQKYANRGYRYSILEAGHAAQNACLYAAENGLGMVEIGGYKEKEISELVGLDYPTESPLITLISGEIA
ncbi:MAG: SagB family peptide dehydrogenase [bacterium]|nr:SagB family peptide dehydrogenase [bacterium]